MKLKKRLVLTLFIFAFLISLLFVTSAKEKVSEEVNQALQKKETVRVIVKLIIEEESEFFIMSKKTSFELALDKERIKDEIEARIGKENIKHVFDDSIALEISNDYLALLTDNPNIESIILDPPIHAFLQDSVPLINATEVWPIQLSDINITGIDETVCILDTGINFSHPDLIGKNKTCVIDCLGKACTEDCSIDDDNGHGTHVAGIVVASGGINGVAIGANLIGVKVLDSNGNGVGTDLYAGIDWCVDNSDTYNISVISMSLGDCSNHSTYCNSDGSASHINAAIGKNISVIVASGNGPSGSCTGISNTYGPSSPACVENATAVGAVDDSDNIWYQRGALFELLAPGKSIVSTKSTGGYIGMDGTSMAAPHVAGAVALLKEFFKLQSSKDLTSDEIKSALNNTGVLIDDSAESGYNFSRIDVFSALISLDAGSPEASLIIPENNTVNSSQNYTFRCNATDAVKLKNITLQIWNSSSLYYEDTESITGRSAESEWNISEMPYGTYEWNCLAHDSNGNSAFASLNSTLIVDDITLHVIVIGIDGFQYNRYVDLLMDGRLSNFTRLMANGGWNDTLNITGHSATATAPGNAELNTGLNETLTGITDNTDGKSVPDGNTTFERIENFNSRIATGVIYGKTTGYIPNGVLWNCSEDVDWWQNRSSYPSTPWPDSTACDDSRDVAEKATEFIGNYSNSSFYLFVYFGVPDCSGHAAGDNSLNYNNSIINADDGLGVILDSLEGNNLNESTQIIITADHGWNTGTTSHSTPNSDTIVLPLITNNYSMVSYIPLDNVRKQCEVAPTTLAYFGIPESDYPEIVDNGCKSMIERDLVSPLITINSPTATTYTDSSILFNLTLDENGYCEFSLDDGITNYTMSSIDDKTWNSTQSLSDNSYTVDFYCNDSLGNVNYSESLSFTVSVPAQQVLTSSGGGGGGITSKTYSPTAEETSRGYTQELAKNDKVKFTFFVNAEQHTLTLDYIGKDFVNLTILSTPLKLVLGIGQSAKLNLSSDTYYDLFIKLESIENNKANLTIQTINELIPKPVISGEVTKSEPSAPAETKETEPKEKPSLKIIGAIIFSILTIVTLITIVLVIILINKTKNETHKTKSQREEALPYYRRVRSE